ncbi:MAG: IclR family transcriptional regulator [Rhodospirillales bacterium]|nr:IclR family transcriptional regulator [Rhodospirillales bacterium]
MQSIEVGGRLLGVMAEAAQPLMLRDLAARAALTPAQAHAYLTSFRKLGLVEQDPGSGRYSLGPFALQLGLARMRSFAPLRAVSRAAVDLAEELGLMVTVAVWGNFGATIVQVHESVDQVHVNLRAGTVFSLTGTATGRVFAAFLPEAIIQPRIRAELKEGTRTQRVGTAATPAQAATQRAEVRRLGYATTEGVPVPGINALSAPVLDHAGQVLTVITVIGPATALPTGPDTPQLAALLTFTRRLSGELGYRAA